MTLTKEQVAQLKDQLREQVKDLPDQQKQAALQQIDDMSDEAIEAMLKEQQAKAGSQDIFRSIVSGEIPARKIDENKTAIAVLSTKAVSKGHAIIIPKNAVKNAADLPAQAFSLAKKVAKKAVSKLKAEGSEVQTEFAFGEIVINVMPVYDKPVNVKGERYDVSEDEMVELYNLLHVKPRPKVIRQRKSKKPKKVIVMDRRIP